MYAIWVRDLAKNMFKKIVSEPLLHFLMLALVFFVVYTKLNPQENSQPKLIVSEGRVQQIKNQFIKMKKREPFADELQAAIQGYVVNEIYALEAKKLGLDQDDAIINRRLSQKMRFLLEDMASVKEPSDAELEAYFSEHSDKYVLPAQWSFEQVFVSTEGPSKQIAAKIIAIKAAIEQGQVPQGDATLLPKVVENQSEKQIERSFGRLFIKNIQGVEVGKWSEPLASDFGVHLVFVKHFDERVLPPLEEVKAAVASDWQRQNLLDLKQQFEKELLQHYQVEIEMPQIVSNTQ